MEILSSKVRVSIGYQKRRETYVFNSYVNEYNLIQDSLNLFQIEVDDWEEWVLIIGETNSRARCSDHLRDGDSLTLVRKVKVDLSSCQLKKETIDILEEKEKEKEDEKEDEDENQESFTEANVYKPLLSRENSPNKKLSSKKGSISQTDDEINQSVKDEELPIKINIKDLESKSYSNRQMLKRELDKWCGQQRMGLIFKSQERELVDGTKISILYCDKKHKHGCSFTLEYRSDTKGNLYKLHKANNCHNHHLDKYDSRKTLDTKVMEKIKTFVSSTKSYLELANVVNKECKTNFHWRTVYYQAKKMEEEILGNPSEDANNFIKMLRKDANERNGFYSVELKNNQLINCCFMTRRMKNTLKYFSDVLIIDATHKINRFNMPLLDIVVIDNYGKTVTCFFALLSNLKQETYVWALEKFKSQLVQNPNVIFSDEEDALTNGNFI